MYRHGRGRDEERREVDGNKIALRIDSDCSERRVAPSGRRGRPMVFAPALVLAAAVPPDPDRFEWGTKGSVLDAIVRLRLTWVSELHWRPASRGPFCARVASVSPPFRALLRRDTICAWRGAGRWWKTTACWDRGRRIRARMGIQSKPRCRRAAGGGRQAVWVRAVGRRTEKR